MKIAIEVQNATNKLFVTSFIGEGHCEGYPFDVVSVIPSGCLVVHVDDKRYLVSSSDVVQAVVAEVIKEKEQMQCRPD